ncbi:MAG TPA: response regulator [Anaeromyxobacter sp.]|nr:response regulator [Anaeromyxobacter sp.]
MSIVEFACVFVRASGDRLNAAERLVIALPGLFGSALQSCDLRFRPSPPFLGVTARFGEGGLSQSLRDRLAFWTARAGGRAAALGALSRDDLLALHGQLDACPLARDGIAPGELFEVAGRFFGEAGAPPNRRREAGAQMVLSMDVGGPGWEGARYVREGGTLFVAAPMAPPVGDALALAFRLPGTPRPVPASATVIEVRRPASAGPGAPAGYTLRLESPPPVLEDALAKLAPAGASEHRAAPRFPVSAPVRVIAPPPPPAAGAEARALIEYATDQELAADFLENLSQGGAFVRSASPPSVGTPVSLELKLPNGAELVARAVVAFVNPHGMGVRFTLDPEAEAVLSAAIASISARPRRALVVDDDALVRRMLADALADRGFEILTAGDAREGLRTLSEELLALDLLVTDVRMPGMDGEELVRLIRKTGGETDLAIVAVSGKLEPGLEPKLEAAGADAVLDKALGPELIAQAADAVLERKRLTGRSG